MRYPKNRKSSSRKGNALGVPKTPSEHACANCGGTFIGHSNAKSCSLRCLVEPQIEKGDGCWAWKGYKRPNGYGEVYRYRHNRRERLLAHRAVYSAFKGDPGDLFVCHRCDNPECVNPDHLFLGTPGDNTADRDAKGRQARGERVGPAKLTEADIRAIRADPRERIAIARAYGVASTTIRSVLRRKTWKHVV